MIDSGSHLHILSRIEEVYGAAPVEQVGKAMPNQPIKSDFPAQDEEVKIADRILKAAALLAATPPVEDIIRQATELKRIHTVEPPARA